MARGARGRVESADGPSSSGVLNVQRGAECVGAEVERLFRRTGSTSVPSALERPTIEKQEGEPEQGGDGDVSCEPDADADERYCDQ